MTGLSLTRGLAQAAATPPFDEVPADVRPLIRNGFIDTLAVLLGGRQEAVTRAALATAAHRRAATPAAAATEHVSGRRLDPVAAAFVNGVAAHALDYDDMALNGHPSVVLVPALLAAGEPRAAGDAALLRAYLVGYETWAELNAREPDRLHGKGWHPTSVIGTVAAAAAVAHLGGLDETACAHALGIAASLSGGLMGNFGSMTKPLHAGWAAAHALEAVQLAQAGVTASADILEGPAGYLAAYSPAGRADRGPLWPRANLQIRSAGLSVKQYPVCYASHRLIDGVLALRARHGLRASDITAITATLSDVNARVLHSHAPQDALQAKFSLEFACATAALDGAVGLAQVTDGQLRRPELRALMARVRAETVPAGCPIEPSFALHDRVCIHLRSGAELDSGPIRFARGHAQLPLTEGDLRAKFLGCVAAAEQGAATRLLDVWCAVDGGPQATLLPALAAFHAVPG